MELFLLRVLVWVIVPLFLVALILGPARSWRFHRTTFGGRSHLWIDNSEIMGTREFFRTGIEVHDWQTSVRDTLARLEIGWWLRMSAALHLWIFLSCQELFPASL